VIPPRVREIMGVANLDDAWRLVDQFCRECLGSPVDSPLFLTGHTSAVFGVRLKDGEEVVVKARGARDTPERLQAVMEAQRRLIAYGFPCPAPVLGPRRIGTAWVSVERLVTDVEPGYPHDPACRRAMAAVLADITRVLWAFPDPHRLSIKPAWVDFTADGLWPEPHHPAYDFCQTSQGAEWIDKLAEEARCILLQANGPMVITHGDFEAQNMAFSGSTVRAVFDWDSLVFGQEAILVGIAAGSFAAERRSDLSTAPTPSEARSFVDEYEAATGTTYARLNRRVAAAATAWIMAYNARCDHAVRASPERDEPPWFLEALARHGSAYLRP